MSVYRVPNPASIVCLGDTFFCFGDHCRVVVFGDSAVEDVSSATFGVVVVANFIIGGPVVTAFRTAESF